MCYRSLRVFFIAVLIWVRPLSGADAGGSPTEALAAMLQRVEGLFDPTNTQTLTTTLEVVRQEGLPKELAGRRAEVMVQAPDLLRVKIEIEKQTFETGRNHQELWIWEPGKNFGLRGVPGMTLYRTAPGKIDTSLLNPISLMIPREQLAMVPLLFQVESMPGTEIAGEGCFVLRATVMPQARALLKELPSGSITFWVRERDGLPVQIGYTDGKGLDAAVAFRNLRLQPAVPMETWQLSTPAGAKVERVALSHLKKFFPAALSVLTTRVTPLGPATGERTVVASHGLGRLENQDGTRVLFLKGTPEEMGEQHGKLMKRQVKDLVSRVLYGVGVGSSFEKGHWFFGEIEDCQARIQPFIGDRYLREMDALAKASGHDREELRLANFFPELFHCSGFCLFGDATQGGRMYHGRILDYMKGIGLELNATVIIHQPDEGNAWVNISYAGFVGSVTAMNEKHISMGEMGGRGEGQWDGKPMAQLVREVMENASTLDEALAILRKGPRTCEYYYVIADGIKKTAVGIAATPTTFEVIRPGESHPRLPHAIHDAVLLSAGNRYEELAKRVQASHGKFDATSARELMTRPVCMTSNIHSVLFCPDTLDFWVANADDANPASHCRYTGYNLAELLKAGAKSGSK